MPHRASRHLHDQPRTAAHHHGERHPRNARFFRDGDMHQRHKSATEIPRQQGVRQPQEPTTREPGRLLRVAAFPDKIRAANGRDEEHADTAPVKAAFTQRRNHTGRKSHRPGQRSARNQRMHRGCALATLHRMVNIHQIALRNGGQTADRSSSARLLRPMRSTVRCLTA